NEEDDVYITWQDGRATIDDPEEGIISIMGVYAQKVHLEPTFTNDEILNPIDVLCNYPNPFNPVTNISYSIPQDSDVKLEMFNIKGQLVKVLIDNFLGKGFYTVTWDGSDLSNNQVTSGIYFYRLKVDNNFSEIKKCLLLK
ncbi:MAG: T9SS type A sorting domain-containing protein, partial [Candidatus Cloacimonetes bacterium]|nr:T9SS type A sorting domain-containing protein [Candidatus Cloacimonadota bacterium]